MENNRNSVEIIEHYGDYVPPFPVKEVVADLLSGISGRYLIGLHSVALINSKNQNRSFRRTYSIMGGRKGACHGIYLAREGRRPATIELLVDNIIERQPGWSLRFKVVRRTILGRVLFHEIGHHMHHTLSPEHNDKELLTRQLYGAIMPRKLLFRG